jgi:hypothetical protein
MARKEFPNKTAMKQDPTYVVQDLTLVAPNRNRKDIIDLKESVVLAESVYYPNRVKLYDLYHDITTMDGFLKGIMQKRIDNLLNKSIKFIDKSGKENEELTELISGQLGRDLMTKIIESKFWGISGVEFIIGEKMNFQEIPRKHIKPEKGIVSTSQYSVSETTNFVIDQMPFVWVIGDKKDLGCLLACSMYAIYKRGNFGDWAQYVEIFGQPVRIIYYDAYDTKTRGELKTLLDTSGSSLAMMIPKQAEFEMMDGKTSNGDGKLQDAFKEACNQEMAIAILGNTETTSSSKSSGYAQSKEHGDQQNEITKSDMAFIINMLNSEKFTTILKSYGFVVEGKFIFEKELDVDRLKTRMEIDTFVSSKVPVGDDYWYDTYGIPKPDNYDELKAKMEVEEEEEEPEPNIDSKQPNGKVQKAKAKSKEGGLTETKKANLFDLMLKGLADFFDQAQL